MIHAKHIVSRSYGFRQKNLKEKKTCTSLKIKLLLVQTLFLQVMNWKRFTKTQNATYLRSMIYCYTRRSSYIKRCKIRSSKRRGPLTHQPCFEQRQLQHDTIHNFKTLSSYISLCNITVKLAVFCTEATQLQHDTKLNSKTFNSLPQSVKLHSKLCF